jgi:hypothetical protein
VRHWCFELHWLRSQEPASLLQKTAAGCLLQNREGLSRLPGSLNSWQTLLRSGEAGLLAAKSVMTTADQHYMQAMCLQKYKLKAEGLHPVAEQC